MNKRYAYIRLSPWDFGAFRLLGPGLGNLLFPWARAVIASKKYDLTPIWPTWAQVKVGPILRREPDLRFYTRLFENPGDYTDGVRKIQLMTTAKRLPEGALLSEGAGESTKRSSLYSFAGMRGLFSPFVCDRDEVRRELLRIVRKEHLAGISHDFRQSITVHVRLGDFRPFDESRMREGAFNIRLPQAWIIETIRAIREHLGEEWPVWLFSDGNDRDLKDILNVRNVYRLNFGSALADMLAMSRSNVLLVSSTFSMWSAFLGGVPSVYYPGQMRQKLIAKSAAYEVEREPRAPFSNGFLDALSERIGVLS